MSEAKGMKNFVVKRFHNLDCDKPEYKLKLLKVNDLGDYIAGLWEGDGHIWIPKNTYSPGGKKYTPHFCITFHEINRPLVIKLQSILGGYIRHKKKEHALVLVISSHNEIVNIIELLNGRLRTPKEYQFKSLITWINLNNQSKPNSTVIVYKGLAENTTLLNNSWFAGFIDSDGSFDIKVSPRAYTLSSGITPKSQIAVRFRLEQRLSIKEVSYKKILSQISKEFNLNLTNSKHKEKTYWLLASTHQDKLETLYNYLHTYPLLTVKRFNMLDWSKAYQLIRTKQHLTNEGRIKILTLKAGMNNSRNLKVLDWSFLD